MALFGSTRARFAKKPAYKLPTPSVFSMRLKSEAMFSFLELESFACTLY